MREINEAYALLRAPAARTPRSLSERVAPVEGPTSRLSFVRFAGWTMRYLALK
jgi:hypothetical protein